MVLKPPMTMGCSPPSCSMNDGQGKRARSIAANIACLPEESKAAADQKEWTEDGPILQAECWLQAPSQGLTLNDEEGHASSLF